MNHEKGAIRFGCFLPIPASPVDKLLKIAKVNEEAGFDSIWVPDHLLFIPPGIVPEAWSTLAATATVTEKAILGTCVSDPHRYHPAVLAQKVATVDQISGGRAILGLGAGEAMNLEPYGVKWKKPVSKLIEFVTIVRKLWSGEMFDYEGKFWKLKDAFLQISPSKETIPIYFGANGTRTLELTGKMADGWLSIPLSPRLYEKRLGFIKEGAEKASRSLGDIDMGVYLYTSVTEKTEDAYKQINTIKSQVIPSPELLKEAGYHVELPEELQSISYFKALLNSEWTEKFLAFGEIIPLEAAIEFSIAGTVEDCIEKIDEYIKAGVKHFLLLNVGPDPRNVVKAYGEEIIPYFKNE
jgi:alkanesulfonate monooxygenase SsuD/methylene tetrahydromethanopterin reductase-like flavin-dependent oxidoreductase (luciferase family)